MKSTFLRSAAIVFMTALAAGSWAGSVDLADLPLGNSIDPAVKPNIMFILDKSGSMSWTHMPDDPLDKNPNNMLATVGYKSSQCNGVYYNPSITYVPPVKADGTSYPNATFTSAWVDGFNTSSGTINLSTSFQAYTSGTLSGASYSGNDTAQPAYYFQYNGLNGGTKQPAMSYSYSTSGTVQSNQFYTECSIAAPAPANPTPKSTCNTTNTNIGAAASHTWTCVQVGSSEQQNFANWYSYYRTRVNMMKSAAGLALKELNSPNFVRLGLVYHDFNSFTALADYSSSDKDAGGNTVTNTCPGTTQRAKLYCALYGAAASGGTPTRTALSNVGQIYAHTLSGYADPVQFKCQRNAAILASDGFWNGDCNGSDCSQAVGFPSVGNTDSGGTAPANDTSPASTNSMADIAAYFYKTQIRSTLDNPPPSDPAIAACPQVPKQGWVRQTAADCATYVHMNTFTLGLGGSGSLKYVWGYQTTSAAHLGPSDDFNAISQLTTPYKYWPNPIPTENVTRMDDLWHAAVDGHGLYFAASNASTLANGLKQAFAATAETGGGSGPSPNAQVVTGSTDVYQATYKTSDWVGDLSAFQINPTNPPTIAATAAWSAQSQLDSRTGASSDTRKIYMAKGATLVDFLDTNLATPIANHWFDAGPTNPNGQLEQYQFFSANQITAATPQSLIAYVRGQRGLEDSSNDTTTTDVTKLYRGRTHVLGDIVHSQPVYLAGPVFDFTDSGYGAFKSANASRAGVVYVGANDGMLHAFNATTGAELWAYVPTAALPNLYKLADKNYAVKHQYYVDGWITIGDVDFGGGNWHTVLISGLGKGGRGYFALDITNPTSPQMLWEFTSTSTATATGGFDADLGYTPDGAQLTKVSSGPYNGKWVAMFASGYNNTSPGDGQARLYVLDAQTGAKLSEIVTAGGSDPLTSSIGWVQGWQDDGMRNANTKDVYAGDLGGRVWRFDMAAQTATLLTTLGSASMNQPVSSRVELGAFANDVNQRVVYVGTGRYLGYCDIDPTGNESSVSPIVACPAAYQNASVQSLYAIRDTGNGLKSNIGSPYFRSAAIPLGTGNRNGTLTYNNVTTNTNGWYLDFNAEAGERVVIQPRLDPLTQHTLVVATIVPANDKCAIGGTGWLYQLATQPSSSYTAPVNTWIPINGALITGFSSMLSATGQPITTYTTSAGTMGVTSGSPGNLGTNVRRVSWRELLN